MPVLNNAPNASVVYGDQVPRILWSPPAPTSAGTEAIDLAADFGLNLDPWQQLVLLEALKEREDGKWAAFEVGLMVSRQSGKGSILCAVEAAGLFLFNEKLILHTAHELKTSKEAMRRLEALIKNSGERFKVIHSHGEESIELLSGHNAGARVMFQTRTKVAGLGLSIDRVIFDEAMIISPEAVQALIPTLSAMPNAQLWYTGSAVDQRIHANCEAFSGLRQRALNGGDPRLCYMEWSCEPGVDPTLLRERARANPGMGYRITPETIEDEYRSFNGMGNLRAFGVQRLGIGDWPLLGAARSAIPAEKWATFSNPLPTYTSRPVLVLYRAPEGGAWAITAAQRTDDGRIHIEVGYSGFDPATEVIEKFVDTITKWDPAAVIVGRGGAAEELPGLEAVGVEAIVPSPAEEAQACGGFLNDALADDDPPLLSHSKQQGLTSAIAQAEKKNLPTGGFTWKFCEGYAQLMGATLAHWALVKYGVDTKTGPLIYTWSDEDEAQWLADEANALGY